MKNFLGKKLLLLGFLALILGTSIGLSLYFYAFTETDPIYLSDFSYVESVSDGNGMLVTDYKFAKFTDDYIIKEKLVGTNYDELVIEVYPIAEPDKMVREVEATKILQKNGVKNAEFQYHKNKLDYNALVKTSGSDELFYEYTILFGLIPYPKISLTNDEVSLHEDELRIAKDWQAAKFDKETETLNYYDSQVTTVSQKLEKYGIRTSSSSVFSKVVTFHFSDQNRLSELNISSDISEMDRIAGRSGIFEWKSGADQKELAHLLAPKGEQDVFQDITLYGAYSKDGKDHVLASYEELMTYYKGDE